MKSRKLAASLSLAFAIGAGGCDSGPVVPMPDYGPITADSWFQEDDKQTLNESFEAFVAFTVGRGVTDMADVKLVLIEGEAQYQCAHNILMANGPGPVYCDDKLYVNARFVNVSLAELARKATSDPTQQKEIRTAGQKFVVGHEGGHAIQEIQGAINEPPEVYQPSKEPQADCYSGEFVQASAPEHVDEAVLLLGQFPEGDLAHGSPAVRMAAFSRGASGGGCDALEIVALRNSIEDQLTLSPQPS